MACLGALLLISIENVSTLRSGTAIRCNIELQSLTSFIPGMLHLKQELMAIKSLRGLGNPLVVCPLSPG